MSAALSLEDVKDFASQLSRRERQMLVHYLASLPDSGIQADSRLMAVGKMLVSKRPRGGARNVKHKWTDQECRCMAREYDLLKPMWKEVKKMARQAQRSTQRQRRSYWRRECFVVYPDLPDDLLNRLDNPLRGDANAQPSVLAILHAKERYGITEAYTPRQLLGILNNWSSKSP